MKRTAIFAVLFFVVANAPLLAKNPSDDGSTSVPPQKPAPSEEKAAKPPDLGVRKLSRRERKERIKNLSEKYRQFLTDVEPIIQAAEVDTFLILDTDPQRDLYIDDFWRRRDVAQGTSNQTFRRQYDVRFIFVQARNGADFRLWTPVGPDAMGELISQDAIGMGVSTDRGVQSVFGPMSVGSSMTNLEWSCNNGDEILKAIAYVQINKTEIGKVFEPTPVNEEDVHKILRSVVLATPNAPKLSTDLSVAFPAKQGA